MSQLVQVLGAGLVATAMACSSVNNGPTDTLGGVKDGGFNENGSQGPGSIIGIGAGVLPPASDASLGSLIGADVNVAEITATISGDPQTCDEAAKAHTYVGCDYWPTVVANNVWSIFDFAVVVANAGMSAATVTVTGPLGTNQTATVPPGQLAKMYLPWVPALKGQDADNCGTAIPLASSVMSAGGAFHLVSDVPVTVYQFNALEYQAMGGPAGKNWGSCTGLKVCLTPGPQYLAVAGCFSFSNDASLLLPSTAMTGNYRVAGHGGVVLFDPVSMATQPAGGYMAITATQNGTTVNVKVSATGQVAAGAAGSGITATNAGGMLTLMLNAGDVAELLGVGGSDLSGSIVQATSPVQVITGDPCYQIPPTSPACDHMEESVFPAETLGKDYVVTRPAGPVKGAPVAHQVRFYGNFDNTHLTYNPAAPPPGCPTTLMAGQVVECGVGGPCPTMNVDYTKTYNCGMISQDFEVTGDQPFAVGMFTLGASIVDPGAKAGLQMGDPAQSFATAVEQYRTKYVFLAPNDYSANYVDIVSKPGATITLDPDPNTTPPPAPLAIPAAQLIGTSGYGVSHVPLTSKTGVYVLNASQPVGIQVVGYGAYTSYMYPGGLNLVQIAPPPVIK